MMDKGKDGSSLATSLFDNDNDPYQMTDIADQKPELVSELKAGMDQWLEISDDPWRDS